jgi:hypothetical protein
MKKKMEKILKIKIPFLIGDYSVGEFLRIFIPCFAMALLLLAQALIRLKGVN